MSVAAATAVLDVIEGDGLVGRAARVGAALADGLRELAGPDPRIGCVRGAGLAQGVVLVSGQDGRTPDPVLASRVVNELRDRHVLISSCGRDANVLKIRPPLVFGTTDVTRLLETLAEVLVSVRTPAGVGGGGSHEG